MATNSDPLQEALRRIEEVDTAAGSKLDLSHLGLGPALRPDWFGWARLRRLSELKRLDLQDNRIEEIPAVGWKALGQLRNLNG
jgi:Leucine-rich repeat (LRR) protein